MSSRDRFQSQFQLGSRRPPFPIAKSCRRALTQHRRLLQVLSATLSAHHPGFPSRATDQRAAIGAPFLCAEVADVPHAGPVAFAELEPRCALGHRRSRGRALPFMPCPGWREAASFQRGPGHCHPEAQGNVDQYAAAGIQASRSEFGSRRRPRFHPVQIRNSADYLAQSRHSSATASGRQRQFADLAVS